MPCPPDTALAQFVDGTLADDASAEIEDHIDHCASCRQTVSATARRGNVLQVGTKIGRYELLAPLGAGAMGVVYSAFDPDLDRKIAVKLLAGGEQLASRQERLAREARALAKISHPNVVPVHDVGVADGRLFIAMELVDGHSLRDHIGDKQLDLIVQAGRGLAAAHAAGVIHRDFKPDNVFVGRDGRVRVGDFGLAAGDVDARAASGDMRVTQSGALLGTPAYMAPEQLRGEPATAASDQFALCVTAWEILFGARPFAGTTPGELLDAIAKPPPDPTGDRRVAAVLRRGLSSDPAQRYPDVSALLDALARAAKPRRTAYVAAGVVACVAIAGGAMFALRDDSDPCRAPQLAWNAQARTNLHAAFRTSGSPLGVELAETTARAIDRWSARFSAAAVGACHDRKLGAELYAAREQCLNARAGELAALLDIFARADAATVERAPSAVGELGDVDRCATAHAAVIPVERRAEHARAQLELARGHALRAAGRYAEAMRVLAAIPEVPDAALLADAEIQLGICANSLGDLAAAQDHFSRAVARADAARDDRLRAGALIETLSLVGDEAAQLHEATRLEEQARAAVERAGSPPLLAADLAATIGDVELRRGRFDVATKSYNAALAGYRANHVDDIRLADVLNSAAGAYSSLGDHATALKLFNEAIATGERAVGRNHPLIAAIAASMVQSLYETGRKDEAFAAARRAIAIYEHAFGARHAKLAAAIGNLAILDVLEERFDDAIPLLERSLAMTVDLLGAEHPDVATIYLNIASANKAIGKLDAAATAYERAIAIWEKTLGTQHLDLARPLNGLGEVELMRKAPDKAIPLFERALAIREAAKANPDHLAHTRFLLAQALIGRDRTRALALASKARGHYAEEKADEDVADIDHWLATVSAARRAP